jgi:superfamily II DNA/RNA helicase
MTSARVSLSHHLHLQKQDRAHADWKDLVENYDIVKAIYDLDFVAPSHIQCQVIPILTGTTPGSLIAQSPSGCSQTVAFAISMLTHVKPYVTSLQAICLVNTLTLVEQTFKVCQALNTNTKFNLGWTAGKTIEGDWPFQVLIGTPSAVAFAMSCQGIFSTRYVRILIVGETDERGKKPLRLKKGKKALSEETFYNTLDMLIGTKLPTTIPIGFFSDSSSEVPIASIKKWRPEVIEVRKQEVPKEIHHFYFVTNNPEQDAIAQLQRIAQQRFVSQGIIFLATMAQAGRNCDGTHEARDGLSVGHGRY